MKLAASFTKVVGILSGPHALPFFSCFKLFRTWELVTGFKIKVAESFDLMCLTGLSFGIVFIFSASFGPTEKKS